MLFIHNCHLTSVKLYYTRPGSQLTEEKETKKKLDKGDVDANLMWVNIIARKHTKDTFWWAKLGRECIGKARFEVEKSNN